MVGAVSGYGAPGPDPDGPRQQPGARRCALLFGLGLFSESKWAPLFGMAFSTVLIIIGSTTSSFGDAGAKATTRVIQITLAVVYAVVAFNMLRSLLPRRES